MWSERLESDGDVATWEELRLTNRPLPVGTRTVLLRLSIIENVSIDAANEFDGHYVDDVSLSLIRR